MSTTSEPFWLESIEHNGHAPYHPSYERYAVFRNVRDFSAVGDGVADDTAAINRAISSLTLPLDEPVEGERCGFMGESSTVAPVLVYFPSGTYRVTAPLISFYYTQLVGSASKRPTILADPSFQGFAVIDEDPYGPEGKNWYTNQNNFFREVRNLVVRLTELPPEREAIGIHHQVSQATGLYNVDIHMQPGSCQRGIFMENGSGGILSSLKITGGHTGAVFGNQQFTVQDLEFEGCSVAIDHIWSWGWVFQNIKVARCNTGILLRAKASMESDAERKAQAVSACTLLDWDAVGTHTVVLIEGLYSSISMVVENMSLRNCAAAVRDARQLLLPGPGVDTHTSFNIPSWFCSLQGAKGQLPWVRTPRSSALLNDQGKYFRRSRPQYEKEPSSSFFNAKSWGAIGDGRRDDTQALQSALDATARNNKILFIPHGTYLVSSTVHIPVGTRIVGEVWSVLMGYGSAFNNASRPQVVFRAGHQGEGGILEVSDLIFTVRGPAPGAIVLEWNVRQLEGQPGSVGLWDSHVRIGGFSGSNLEADTTPSRVPHVTDAGRAGLLGLHITKQASCYASNVWVWVGDHDLDLGSHEQINVFCARGVLIEADPGPVWLYGTGSEHSVLYQYNFHGARNVVAFVAQTETPYMLGERFPLAAGISKPDARWGDPVPMFPGPTGRVETSDPHAHRSWGVVIQGCYQCFFYGLNLYSFFDDYDQTGLQVPKGCQKVLLRVEADEQVFAQDAVYILQLVQVGTELLMVVNGKDGAGPSENQRNGFSSCLPTWTNAALPAAGEEPATLH